MEGHLDPAQFHGFVSGTLSLVERDAAVLHLDRCARCRQLLSALASGPGDEDPARTLDGSPPEGLEAVLPPRRAEPGRKLLDISDTTAPDASHLVPTQESAPVKRQAPLDAPPLPPSDRLIGQRLGDYVVQELIAKGGMGAVYRGVQPLIGKQVAIKVLLTPGPEELQYAQRMLEEARTVNAIGHPNIIDIFNFGELPDGRPWLVMEYLDGLSVSQWVRARTEPEPPTGRIIQILEQICAALEAVHAVGVVHRDLKPANVMLMNLAAPLPRVKVLDFGFAKSRDATLRTSPDMVLGTPGYMSPEQIQAHGATAQSDLYALGLVAYFMLTGLDAYADKSPIAVLQLQLQKEPASLRGRPGIPDALAQLVADLTRISPSLRPPTARAVRERLEAIAAGVVPSTAPSDVITVKDEPPAPPPSVAEAKRPTHKDRPQRPPDLDKTEPEREAFVPGAPTALESAVDEALAAASRSPDLSKSQLHSVRSTRWPYVLAVVLASALGVGAWLALR
ncbi:MAG: protein kinase [Myxococcaceae bacterium]|nr:protein kinase [Myxococcaceae bacterium]